MYSEIPLENDYCCQIFTLNLGIMHGAMLLIALSLVYLTIDLDSCRAKDIQWSMVVEVLMVVAAIGSNIACG